jgi:hypothetical protein
MANTLSDYDPGAPMRAILWLLLAALVITLIMSRSNAQPVDAKHSYEGATPQHTVLLPNN